MRAMTCHWLRSIPKQKEHPAQYHEC